MAASQKLSHLLQLADQGPALRAALAEEVAELLTAWPPDYPESMRGMCEALLAKAARDVDAATRALLKAQLETWPDLSNLLLPHGFQPLIETARKGGDLTTALAQNLGVESARAEKILGDASGAALALACKGAGFDRAAFSALALLVWPARDRSHAFALLDAFDAVAADDAARILHSWQQGRAAA